MAALILGIAELVIVGMAIWFYPQTGSALPGGAVIVIGVLAPIFLAILIALLLIGVHDKTRTTVMLSLLGLLATSIAWLLKKLFDSLELRAQVLIQELLADGPKPRAAIRAHVCKSHFLYRLNRSVYVDALAALLSTKVVRMVPGRIYELVEQDPR